jgi:hypothetical protein
LVVREQLTRSRDRRRTGAAAVTASANFGLDLHGNLRLLVVCIYISSANITLLKTSERGIEDRSARPAATVAAGANLGLDLHGVLRLSENDIGQRQRYTGTATVAASADFGLDLHSALSGLSLWVRIQPAKPD